MRILILSVLMLLILNGCGDSNNKDTVSASGNIEAINITVSSKVTGEVITINKDEGDRVSAGDTIMIIDHEALNYQLDQADAGVEMNQAQLNLLKSGAREEDIRQAEEMMRQAEINYELAAKDKQRMDNLYEAKSITKKQFEDAAARVEMTSAQMQSARENLKKMKNLARPEEINQANANLKMKTAAADLLRKNIRDSYVISPIDGIIVKRFVERGEVVSNFSSLFRISNLEVVDLIIYISQLDLGRIKQGDKVDISVDTFPDKTFEGEIVYISPEAEFTPKNIQTKDERTKLVFAVKVKINNPDLELKAGMPADAVVYLSRD
jgi:HlyD family secretion protein